MQRIDAIFEIERRINGADAATRLAVRRVEAAPLVEGPEAWLRIEREKPSRHAPVAKAIDHMLKRWDRFTRFLDDGRVCLSNNAAERALRGVSLGRKSWLFCGSDRGGDRADFMYTLIQTAKLNEVDPQAWLADVLARIATSFVRLLRRPVESALDVAITVVDEPAFDRPAGVQRLLQRVEHEAGSGRP